MAVTCEAAKVSECVPSDRKNEAQAKARRNANAHALFHALYEYVPTRDHEPRGSDPALRVPSTPTGDESRLASRFCTREHWV